MRTVGRSGGGACGVVRMNAHPTARWLHPVKHGLPARPADWPHSPIHRDICRRPVEPEWPGPSPDGRFGEQGGLQPASGRTG